MRPRSHLFRKVFIPVLATSLLGFPLAMGSTLPVAPAGAATPFQTVRPQAATFTPAVGELEPVPTAMPTLFPGQYFEAGDSGRPGVDPDRMEGDLQYGFQRLSDNPNMYMVWMTDAGGTHYMIVGADSDVLTGGNDSESGYFFLVRERERIHGDISTAAANRDTHHRSATELRWGTVALLVGTGVCAVLAGPVCLVGLGLAGGAFWASRGQDTNAEIQQNTLEGLRDQLSDVEGDLRFGFRTGQVSEIQS